MIKPNPMKKKTEPWVSDSSRPIQEMYALVCEKVKTIERRIRSGQKLTTRMRKINKESIAESLGKNKAYINRTNCPELNTFIDNENTRLARIAEAEEKINRDPEKRINELDRLNRVELIEECRRLRKKLDKCYKEIASGCLVAFYNEAAKLNKYGNEDYIKTLNSEIIHRDVDIRELRRTNRSQRDQITQLKHQIKKATTDLEGCKKKIDAPSKRSSSIKVVK